MSKLFNGTEFAVIWVCPLRRNANCDKAISAARTSSDRQQRAVMCGRKAPG